MVNKSTYIRRDDPEPSRRLHLLQEGVRKVDNGSTYFGGMTLSEKLSEITLSDRLGSIMGIPSGEFKSNSPISYEIVSIAEYSSAVVLAADLNSNFPFVFGWRMRLAVYSTNILVNAITLAVLSDSRAFEIDGSLSEEMLMWYKEFVSELLTM